MKVLLAGGVFRLSDAHRSHRQPAPEEVLAEGLRKRGVDLTTIPLEQRGDVFWAPGFDLVHVHHLSRAAVAAALSPRRVPFVFTPHAASVPTRQRERLGHGVVTRLADAMICLSDRELAMRAADLPQARPRLFVIPNGIAAPERPAVPRTWGGVEPLRVLFVGQLVPVKRVDRIIRAAATQPAAQVRLVFHNAQLLKELRSLAERLCVADRVTFVGQLSGVALRAEYESAHLLALPSVSEALPSVVTEALHSALPVVASDVGGVSGQVQDAGVLSDPDDDAGFGMALTHLQGNYPTIAEASFARAATIRDEYSVDRMVDAHLALYRKLLGQ